MCLSTLRRILASPPSLCPESLARPTPYWMSIAVCITSAVWIQTARNTALDQAAAIAGFSYHVEPGLFLTPIIAQSFRWLLTSALSRLHVIRVSMWWEFSFVVGIIAWVLHTHKQSLSTSVTSGLDPHGTCNADMWVRRVRTEGSDREQGQQDGEVDHWTVMDKGGELDCDG